MKNDDKLKLALLTTLDALVSIGRSDYKIYSDLDHDNIEEIKDWLFKPNDRKGDMVVSKELLAGFKNETVYKHNNDLFYMATYQLRLNSKICSHKHRNILTL